MKGIPAILVGAAIAALAATGDISAQTRQNQPAPAQGSQPAPPPMMEQRQKMMADMQAAQKRLDELVAQMNAATGNAKVDRIAAVLNELVAQHKRMSTMMQGTMPMMMTPNAPATPAPAPPATGKKPEADHQEHHK